MKAKESTGQPTESLAGQFKNSELILSLLIVFSIMNTQYLSSHKLSFIRLCNVSIKKCKQFFHLLA